VAEPPDSDIVRNGMTTDTSTTTARVGRPRDAKLDEAIVRATNELIGERGFANLSLVAIAERAGTTTPAIYRRWSSKTDLVLHAVFRTDGPDVVADTGDLERDLATMVRWTLEKLRHPVGRAALAGLLGEPDERRAVRLPQLETVWRQVGDRLDRAADAGEIRSDVDVSALITVLAGAGMMAALLEGDPRTDDARIRAVVDVMVDGVRARRADVDGSKRRAGP